MIAEIIRLFAPIGAPSLDGLRPISKTRDRMTRGHGPIMPYKVAILLTQFYSGEPPRPACVPAPTAILPPRQGATCATGQTDRPARLSAPPKKRFSEPAAGHGPASHGRPASRSPSAVASLKLAQDATRKIPIGIGPPPANRPLTQLAGQEARINTRVAARLPAILAAERHVAECEQRLLDDVMQLSLAVRALMRLYGTGETP